MFSLTKFIWLIEKLYNNKKNYLQGWKKHKLESRLLGELSITSDMQMTPPLRQKSEEELKSLLMKGKQETEKVG